MSVNLVCISQPVGIALQCQSVLAGHFPSVFNREEVNND